MLPAAVLLQTVIYHNSFSWCNIIFVVSPPALDARDACVHSRSPRLGEKSRNRSGFPSPAVFYMNHSFFHLFCFSRQLFLRRCDAYSFGLQSSFPLMKFFVLAVCFGTLSGCIKKFLPISLDIFRCNLADRMFLSTSVFILLLPSEVLALIIISEPVLHAAKSEPWRCLLCVCLMSSKVWNHEAILSFSFVRTFEAGWTWLCLMLVQWL